ncbi:unnamed protein product [Schistosoma rodhaini]|uniref:XPG-I domain-containing protein n=2 Tax=Schistosoma rodhaini TaxID=6188 RepID=A0AA85FS31_9TREM|nr:unnamed protein product [Schistosoma rodhaini]CAH8558578.1 unnamed protein product [Schistosoma rodhaini]
MGVHGLWGILSSVQEYRPLSKIGCDSVAVDLSIWICGDKSIAPLPALHLRNLFFRLVGLLRENTLPVAVLDGVAPSLKSDVMEQRQQKWTGKITTQKCTKPNLNRIRFSKVSQECIQLLNSFGIPWVQSPGEAEAMCAFLNSNKLVDACITNDGDAFLYGAETVYRHFSMDSRDSSVCVFHMHRIRDVLNLTKCDLVLLGILLGCDYWASGVSRLGPVGALRLISSLKSPSLHVDEHFLIKFLSWLTSTCPQNCEDFNLNPFGLRVCPSVIKMWLRVGVELKNCPYEEIFAEFLTSFKDRNWVLPKQESISQWKRPDPRKAVSFCQIHLNWDPAYTLQHFLPVMALWDLRHPQIYNSPSCIKSLIDYQIDDSVILKPLRIVKKRIVNYVDSYEVEWERLGFDKWSEQKNILHPNDENVQNMNIFDNCNYYFSVPQVEFRRVHSEICSLFENSTCQISIGKKKTKSKLSKIDKNQLVIDEAFKGLSISTKKVNKSESEKDKSPDILTSLTNLVKHPVWESDNSSIDENEYVDYNNDVNRNHKEMLPESIISEMNNGYNSDSEVYNHIVRESPPPSLSAVFTLSSPSSSELKSTFSNLSKRSSSLSNLFNNPCLQLQTSLLSNSFVSEKKFPHSNLLSPSIFSSCSSCSTDRDDIITDHSVSRIIEKFRTPKTLKDRLGVVNYF